MKEPTPVLTGPSESENPAASQQLAQELQAIAEASAEQTTAEPEKPEREKPLFEQISEAEAKLGIETPSERILEAGLVIDKPLLDYALITGITRQPERIFGDEVWADYLDGRQLLRQHGDTTLTPELIMTLQAAMTRRSSTDFSGKLRNLGVQGGALDNPDEPATYTAQEIQAIEQKPDFSFKRLSHDEPDSVTGFVLYPHQKAGEKTRQAIGDELAQICDWYNDSQQPNHAYPYVRAAELQQRLAELHPFRDGNGRVSRALMNWSLESAGYPPAILANPNADITSDRADWLTQVTEGSQLYATAARLQKNFAEVGFENPAAALGLGEKKAFYNYIYRYLDEIPERLQKDQPVNHANIADYNSRLDGQFADFRSQTTSEDKVYDSDISLRQGGLITQDFIQFATSKRAQAVPNALTKEYFGGPLLYRGGTAVDAGELTDEKVLEMFRGYTALESSYRALRKSLASSVSLQPIPSKMVAESMEYYNQSLAYEYLDNKFGAIPEALQRSQPTPKSLIDLIDDHVDEVVRSNSSGILESPFVSTSLVESRGQGFSKYVDGNTSSRNLSILVAGRAPSQGNICSGTHHIPTLKGGSYITQMHGSNEKEVLVSGALQPAAIEQISVWGPGFYDDQILAATRSDVDGLSTISIEELQGDMIETRHYAFNARGQRYEFTGKDSRPKPPPTIRNLTPISPNDIAAVTEFPPVENDPYLHEETTSSEKPYSDTELADWEKDLLYGDGTNLEHHNQPPSEKELKKLKEKFGVSDPKETDIDSTPGF